MAKELRKSALRVQECLSALGVELEVREFADSTRTARDAADCVGCEVGQIAKSLVFQETNSGGLFLVIASGANRVDTKKIEKSLACKLKQAKAEVVKEKTGYAIGGVPPVGHAEVLPTVLDEDLKQHEVIWAAAGTPFAVFQLTPALLETITKGQWLDLRQE